MVIVFVVAVATIFSDQSIIGVDEVLPVLNHRHGDDAMGEQWIMVILLVIIDLNRQLPRPEDITSSLLVTIHHDTL